MIRLIPPLTALGALPLMACAQTPPVDDTPVRGAGDGYQCDASMLGDLVGKPATAELGQDALQRSNSRTLRWIQPGTAVTMDFRQDRLNIKLDEQNVVTGTNCG